MIEPIQTTEITGVTTPPDLSDLIAGQAKRFGEKTFIDSVDQGIAISYREFAARCNQIANYLRKHGIAPGDPVSLVGRNSLETLLIFYGVIKFGAVINPVNVEESPQTIERILRYVKPRMIFRDAEVSPDIYDRRAGMQLPFAIAGRGSELGEARGVFGEFQELDSSFVNEHSAPDDFCEFVFTSGTTSFPKGAVITRKALHLMGMEVAERMELSENDTVLEYRNYNWLSSQTLSIVPSLVAGATLALGTHFSRSKFAGWLREKNVTVSAGVPTVINILVHQPVALHRDDVPSLRFLTSSSAPLPKESQEAFEKLYGIPIVQMAGMTEAGFVLGTPPQARKLGSAGRPCRYKRVQVLDAARQPLPPGQEGEIVIGGEAMALGYLREDGTVERFPEEGFPTGDLGFVDADGYVFITGRVKDLIIKGGVNISPVEITNRIMAHPAVVEAATIGVPDPIYGENVGAFVVAKEGKTVTAEEIVAHCRETLPPFKVPVRVHFVDKIPKTERGKVAKETLIGLVRAEPAVPEHVGR